MITHVYPRECKHLVYVVTTPKYVFKLLLSSNQLSKTQRLFIYYSDDKEKQENPHISQAELTVNRLIDDFTDFSRKAAWNEQEFKSLWQA